MSSKHDTLPPAPPIQDLHEQAVWASSYGAYFALMIRGNRSEDGSHWGEPIDKVCERMDDGPAIIVANEALRRYRKRFR